MTGYCSYVWQKKKYKRRAIKKKVHDAGNAICVQYLSLLFFKSNSTASLAKKPLKILYVARLINVLFTYIHTHTHEKYVARKHGFPISIFLSTYIRTYTWNTKRIQVYPLSDFFFVISVASMGHEMDGAIFYPNWHFCQYAIYLLRTCTRKYIEDVLFFWRIYTIYLHPCFLFLFVFMFLQPWKVYCRVIKIGIALKLQMHRHTHLSHVIAWTFIYFLI